MYKHKAHPWHGISLGENVPQEVTAFIEIVPTDTVKYEVDKPSGYLSIDRPQQYSNIVPALYGFLPRIYCADQVAELTNLALSRTDIQGDNDPLDICILTEKDVTHGDIIVKARPIGGLRLLDNQQADDKIIGVLRNDLVYGTYEDIRQLPEKVIDRLVHYFTTYKDLLPNKNPRMKLIGIYGKEGAYDVIRRAMEDYTQQIRHHIQ
ncbi:MAG: inorganic pyrophosphatase [Bacteroides sp.]|nr:inorganic pyrophosphatase [Bacteroides sp.]